VNLILFSSTYPYVIGAEQNFLENEIKYLLAEFDRVVIVPENVKGERFGNQLTAEVDTSYAEYFGSHNILSIFWTALFSPIVYEGWREKNFPKFSPDAYRRLLAFAGKAEITSRWVRNWLKSNNLDGSDCIFYTFWFDQAAGGITLAKREFPMLKLVSRAHGYDIFEEHYNDPPFWPCRQTVLKLVEKVFADSIAGTAYFVEHYPEFSHLFETAFQGVPTPGVVNQPSTDGVFRIISCSMIRPEKRVERILESVRHAARLRPEQKFEWTHVGNGENRAELQKLADDSFPANAKAIFPGYSDNEALMQLYKEKSFDTFINASRTEGTPVSIMEAISFGIPVIATAVGGNAEIASNRNGIQLSLDPGFAEIANAFFELIDHPDQMELKREGSLHLWETQYNAQLNYSEFARKLKEIRESRS